MKLYFEDGKQVKGLIGELAKILDPVFKYNEDGRSWLVGWREKKKKKKEKNETFNTRSIRR